MEMPTYKDWHAEALLGQGNYGRVFLVERVKEGRTERAALKVIPLDGRRSGHYNIQRIADRILSAVRLNEQLARECINIVQIYDYQVVEDYDGSNARLMVLMELLTPLSEHFSEGIMNERSIMKLGIDICNALGRLERWSVIHKDVKLGNIFVDGRGNYVLGDFGTMTYSGDDLLQSLGVCNHLPPEIFAGRGFTHSADIYGLGMVLYFYLNGGRFPFLDASGELTPAMMQRAYERRVNGEVPVLRIDNKRLARCVVKAIHPDFNKRYHRAEDFKKELEIAGANEIRGRLAALWGQ